MTISTLKIGLLTPSEMQTLSALTREIRCLTDQHYSLLDPKLLDKLRDRFAELGDVEKMRQVDQIESSLYPMSGAAIKVEKYRKYGVRVKYFDRPAA